MNMKGRFLSWITIAMAMSGFSTGRRTKSANIKPISKEDKELERLIRIEGKTAPLKAGKVKSPAQIAFAQRNWDNMQRKRTKKLMTSY
jgi:hypothetical protein